MTYAWSVYCLKPYFDISTNLQSNLHAVIAADLALWIIHLRVGHGNLAMPKVTPVGTMASAIAGGTVLGVLFAHYHHNQRSDSIDTAQPSAVNAVN